MLRNHALAYLCVGHALTKTHYLLFATELADPKITRIGPAHERHQEALNALEYAAYACKDLPLGTLSKEIKRAKVEHRDGSVVDRLKTDLIRLYKRFEDELQDRRFFYVSPEYARYYGQESAFGPGVEEKFPEAAEDVENAGDCLALNQGTACVFHLMRAMEVVVRRLARRFSLPTGLDVTWVVLTGNMTDKIASWPKKHKRAIWSAAVSNLHHVGRATRNPTMHPKKTYTQQQAREVYDAVRVFMVEVGELLGSSKKEV